ncbi:hypothetical protein [Agaribacter flavus]|uniref:Uncharacterized protein n=1 Tax=Agaribacter flavus TaxID=1902781 RepID=A0ABV7FRX4_9ALTE
MTTQQRSDHKIRVTESYTIKQRVLMHPFSDDSGLTFFDPVSNTITSVALTLARFHQILDKQTPVSEQESKLLSELLTQQIIQD